MTRRYRFELPHDGFPVYDKYQIAEFHRQTSVGKIGQSQEAMSNSALPKSFSISSTDSQGGPDMKTPFKSVKTGKE
jgi:hypothetical protein